MDLYSTLSKRNMPVFLGAGCSVAAGAQSGQQIARSLSQLMDQGLYDIAQISFEAAIDARGGGSHRRSDELRRWLDGLDPSSGHLALAQLVKDGVLGPVMLTTNFDNLVEAAFERIGAKLEVVIACEDFVGMTDLLTVEQPTLLKLHGTLEDPESLRATPERVQEIAPQLTATIRALIEERGLVSVGSQMSDFDLKGCWAGEPTKHLVLVVEPGGMTQDQEAILRRHNCLSSGFIGKTFDGFFGELAVAHNAITKIGANRKELERAWRQLDDMRENGLPFPSSIEWYDGLQIPEASAIASLVRYEQEGRASPALVAKAIEALEESTRALGSNPDLGPRIRLRRASEAFQAQLDGSYMRTMSRIDNLQHLRDELQTLIDHPDAHQDWLLQSASRIQLGEVLKELYTALPEPPVELLAQAEIALTQALDLASERLQEDQDQSRALRGRALRHRAVIREYLGARQKDRLKRQELLRGWFEDSESAFYFLDTNDRTRAYAQMNLAQARIAIAYTASRRGIVESEDALRVASEELQESKQVFLRLRDSRGSAWAELHLARLAIRRAAATPVSETAFDRWSEAEEHAAAALVWARRAGPDKVAEGLAALYVATAASRLNQPDWRRVLEMAEYADTSLRQSHRIPQVALSILLQVDAMRQASSHPGEAMAHSLGEALERLAGAMQLLSRFGEPNQLLLETAVEELAGKIATQVPDLI